MSSIIVSLGMNLFLYSIVLSGEVSYRERDIQGTVLPNTEVYFRLYETKSILCEGLLIFFFTFFNLVGP
jgi:hypothetical protein